MSQNKQTLRRLYLKRYQLILETLLQSEARTNSSSTIKIIMAFLPKFIHLQPIISRECTSLSRGVLSIRTPWCVLNSPIFQEHGKIKSCLNPSFLFSTGSKTPKGKKDNTMVIVAFYLHLFGQCTISRVTSDFNPVCRQRWCFFLTWIRCVFTTRT